MIFKISYLASFAAVKLRMASAAAREKANFSTSTFLANRMKNSIQFQINSIAEGSLLAGAEEEKCLYDNSIVFHSMLSVPEEDPSRLAGNRANTLGHTIDNKFILGPSFS